MADIIYSDLDFKYRKVSSSNDVLAVTNDTAINQSLSSLFFTMKGERLCNPEYGTNLQNLLFEPLDTQTASAIIDELKFALTRWEWERIKLTEISINVNYDISGYELFMEYQILNTQKSGTISLILEKV